MSDMKCPFCQQELEDSYCDGVLLGLRCKNTDCLKTNIMYGNELLWQELITTRKALDCAINTLDTVYGLSEDNSNIETYIKCKRIEINGIIKGGKDE